MNNFDDVPWMQRAFSAMGTAEIAGAADNPAIMEYLDGVGLGHTRDETNWCSAFVNWCMESTSIPGTGSAAARSWLNWGSDCFVPQYGAVTVLWRQSPRSWKGHVGFCVGTSAGKVWLLGGNQGNRVCVRKFAQSRVLGYRLPG